MDQDYKPASPMQYLLITILYKRGQHLLQNEIAGMVGIQCGLSLEDCVRSTEGSQWGFDSRGVVLVSLEQRLSIADFSMKVP